MPRRNKKRVKKSKPIVNHGQNWGHAWTKWRRDRLTQLVRADTSWKEIGNELGTTQAACYAAYGRIKTESYHHQSENENENESESESESENEISENECEFCDKCFSTPGNLRFHILKIHKKRPWKCDQCFERFKLKTKLNSHQKYECIQSDIDSDESNHSIQSTQSMRIESPPTTSLSMSTTTNNQLNTNDIKPLMSEQDGNTSNNSNHNSNNNNSSNNSNSSESQMNQLSNNLNSISNTLLQQAIPDLLPDKPNNNHNYHITDIEHSATNNNNRKRMRDNTIIDLCDDADIDMNTEPPEKKPKLDMNFARFNSYDKIKNADDMMDWLLFIGIDMTAYDMNNIKTKFEEAAVDGYALKQMCMDDRTYRTDLITFGITKYLDAKKIYNQIKKL